MKYKIVRLEQVNGDPQVAEVCKLLGYGKVNQTTAQAAAGMCQWTVLDELVKLPKSVFPIHRN